MTEDFVSKMRAATRPAFDSIDELMRVDSSGSVSDQEFDSNLNLLLSRYIGSRGTHADLPKPVLNYYASLSMQAQVENGGFAQAAYNIPHLFGAAADGYEAIGQISAARTIRRAEAASKAEAATVSRLKRTRAGIGAVFGWFSRSSLKAFDTEFTTNWRHTTNDLRRYARAHRKAFGDLDA
jgi:hypothetical protein